MRLGHDVRLIPPQYVKPYVKRNKTDAADAEAICEAVSRPNMRFVPVKTVDKQAVLALHRVIGMDIHRTFAEVVFWQDGRLRWHGRIEMTRSGLEGFGRGLAKDDEVVLEATGNAPAVARVLSSYWRAS